MSLSLVVAGVAALMGVGLIVVGAQYLLAPEATAATFGLPVRPDGSGLAWLNVKGIRDVVSGLVILPLLVSGQFELLGWCLLIAALTPIGDALIVLRHGGSKALAYGVHAATAATLVVLAALLLLVS